ncbi:HlyD family efflux transporter periplasmic adaptor subunit [Ruminococcus flavefaciens]|uniref:HlyD family efflux transporter periplasmic adaptor subunit n=1 Tax=Ruminococcus flavefaciens TaxID=1265 RepID=UPI00048E28B2|nr:biotin/lipoyl-binding protein [Ruminococcus flavefaciens]
MNDTKEVKEITSDSSEKEARTPAKRRELIKTLIIIFLAVMLVLTFFSNTIMNKSLPEISTETVASGKLTERIEKRGVVEANQAYNVTVDGNRVIEKIHIKTGQEVKKDDVLFTVNTVESEKLETEEATLETLKLEYETALLKDPLDYSAENQKIKAARAELNDLIAKRDAARYNDSNAASAKEEYRRNKSEQTRLTGLQEKLQATIRAIDSDSYSEAAPEYSGDLPALCSAYTIAEEDYKSAYETYQMALEAGENVEGAKADADEKEAVRNTARDSYFNEKNNIRGNLASQLSDVSGSLAGVSEAIENYTSEYGEGGTETYDTLAAAVAEKQSALEDLIIELDNTKRKDSIEDKKESLTLESKKKALEKQQEKVDKLKKEAKSTEIKSKYSGIVSSINVQPDATTTPEETLAVIDLADEGFTVKITVENENLKKVKKGVEAEIVNNWNGDITAVLKEIKSDSTSGSKAKSLIFSVTGDVQTGDSLDLSVPLGSGNYDAIVPKNAVHTGDKGSYVYTVRSKNTPLGNRYYAEKVEVNVEASDTASCAVSGGLNRGDYIITASSKPLKSGDQVRMKDK